jgi:hypothetical protein
MDLTKVGREAVDWIHLAENKVKWPDLVNKVMNFGFHQTWAIS